MNRADLEHLIRAAATVAAIAKLLSVDMRTGDAGWLQ